MSGASGVPATGVESRGGAGARLAGRACVVVGAGQTPGDTIGNGRATARLFAHEGGRVACVDRDPEAAEATAREIVEAGGEAIAVTADIVREADDARMVAEVQAAFGAIDVVHHNVGIGAGDAGAVAVAERDWQLVHDVNLKGAYLVARHVVPAMREQGSGVLTFVSSIAAIAATDMVAYKTSKAGLNALGHAIAANEARHGIRCNVILPGLMDTPMAIEGIAGARGIAKDALRSARDKAVPLGRKMGTAWDVAYAALYLASDEARFVSGVLLPVDGGQLARIG